MPKAIQDRASFEIIRYANVWEDADILCRALDPKPGGRILSISSAGDNSFALAAEGAEVVAADLSKAQLALTELKRQAILAFDRNDVLAFFGLAPATNRAARYRDLREKLPASAREFFDARGDVIERGVVHGGKFERYFTLFRTRLLPLVHSRRTVLSLLQSRTREERIRFYEDVWNNRRWRAVFAIFFSRRVMGWLGRDPEFFRYVDGPVSVRILSRVRHAVTELPTHDNPYLEYIMTGTFEHAVPRFLRAEKYDAVRKAMDRVTLHEGTIDAAATAHPGGFSGFNLSDIFEYMDEALTANVYEKLLEHARPKARFAYWNMLAPRRRPDHLMGRVLSLDEMSSELLADDRAFFYSKFVVEEVADAHRA